MGRLRRLSHWILYRKGALIAVCIFLVAVVGYIDYVTGYERPLLLFYLLPISLAVWFGSLLFGLSVAVIAIVAWMWSDLAAGIPALGFWNVGMAFASFALFAGMLSKLRTLVRELDRRVLERRSEEHTSELQSHSDLVCRLLLEKKKKTNTNQPQ